MITTAILFKKLIILLIEVETSSGFRVHWYLSCKKGDDIDISDYSAKIKPVPGKGSPLKGVNLKMTPVVAVFYGGGVVQKLLPADSALVAQMTGNADFLHNTALTAEGRTALSFVRKEWLQKATDELGKMNVHVVCPSVGIVPLIPLLEQWPDKCPDRLLDCRIKYNGKKIEEITPQSPAENMEFCAGLYAARFYSTHPLKKIIGSPTLSMLLFNRLKLTVLLTVFAVVLANMFLLNYFDKKNREQAFLLSTVVRQNESRQKQIGRQQVLLQELTPPIPYAWGFLLDRIASCVSDGLVFNTLEIQPLLKQPENNKSVQVDRGRIKITGESPAVETITSFTSRLKKESFAGQLKLVSIRYDKDKQSFHFEIDLPL